MNSRSPTPSHTHYTLLTSHYTHIHTSPHTCTLKHYTHSHTTPTQTHPHTTLSNTYSLTPTHHTTPHPPPTTPIHPPHLVGHNALMASSPPLSLHAGVQVVAGQVGHQGHLRTQDTAHTHSCTGCIQPSIQCLTNSDTITGPIPVDPEDKYCST